MRYAYQAQVVPAPGEFVARIRHLHHIQYTQKVVVNVRMPASLSSRAFFQSLLASVLHNRHDPCSQAHSRYAKAQMLIKRNGFL